MPRCPVLTRCAERLEVAAERFEGLVGGLSAEQASWRPSPKAWSVAQCVDHVNVTLRLYHERMEPAVERARERGGEGAAPYGSGSLLGRLVLRILDPAGERTVGAPRAFRPSPDGPDLAAVRAEFRDLVARFQALLERSDGLDLGRIRFRNPAFPVFRMTLAEGFEIQSLHIPRHLEQAERLTRAEGFPS